MWRAMVVTVSNRAAAGVYEDTTGPVIVEQLAAAGLAVSGPEVVPDGPPVEAVLRRMLSVGYDLIVTTGGTGISPTDQTPDMTRRVLDYEIPGISEAIRYEGLVVKQVPAASLSRATAGVAGRTLIVNLPGSLGGVRDGMTVIKRWLEHAMSQLHGGDH